MSNELTTTQGNSVAVAGSAVPFRGFEKMSMDSVTIPTAKVLQGQAKELTDETYADYGFRAGMIIHSLLLEKLSDSFIPLMIFDDKTCFVPKQESDKTALKEIVKSKFGLELTNEDMDNMFICRSKDNRSGDRFGACATCGLCKFNGNEAPYCNENVNVLALFEGQELPVVIRFTSTSHKHGRNFKNVAFYSGVDLFKRKYKLLSTKKTDKGNTWYEISARPSGKVEGEELDKAEALYNRFKGMMIEVAEEIDGGAVQSEF